MKVMKRANFQYNHLWLKVKYLKHVSSKLDRMKVDNVDGKEQMNHDKNITSHCCLSIVLCCSISTVLFILQFSISVNVSWRTSLDNDAVPLWVGLIVFVSLVLNHSVATYANVGPGYLHPIQSDPATHTDKIY